MVIMMKKIVWILILFWVGMTEGKVSQNELTYIDLIQKLTDLEDLAEQLKAVDDFLKNDLGIDPAGQRLGEVTESNTISIPSGITVTIAEINEKRASSSYERFYF